MKKFYTNHPFFSYLLLFALGLILRICYLNLVPVSLSHDEIDTVIQAHSVINTGSDLNKSWDPFDFLPNDAVMGELAPVIHLPIFSIFSNSLFTSRLTSAVLGAIFPLLVLRILLSLGFSSTVGYLSALLLAVSPWHILFSRTALEQPTSLFFYTLSWLFLAPIFAKQGSSKIVPILSILLFTISYSLGFYTYHGYKFALPIMTLLLATYFAIIKNKSYAISYKKYAFVVLIILTLIIRVFLYRDYYSSRDSEIILLNNSLFTAQVNHNRSVSVLPAYLSNFFSNKLTERLDLLTHKFLYILSPEMLFRTGEANGVFGTGRSGYLYLFTLPFLLIGLFRIINRHQAPDLLFLSLLFVSPLATMIHQNDAISFRSAIYFVLLTVLCAIGIEYFIRRYPLMIYKLILSLLLILSLFRFLFVYFAYYPKESARDYFFADRLLGTYLAFPHDSKILVLDPQPRYIMSYITLTSKHIDKELLTPLINRFSPREEQNVYFLDNLTIRRDCPDDLLAYDVLVVDYVMQPNFSTCPQVQKLQAKPSSKLSYPLDSSPAKLIYGDTLCEGVALSTTTNIKNITDFGLEDLSRVQFCETWVQKL